MNTHTPPLPIPSTNGLPYLSIRVLNSLNIRPIFIEGFLGAMDEQGGIVIAGYGC
ncbi:MAG: hypothetical protein HUJ96_00120 [Marinilabiliaceae bacterium]|nr:hypothetical protein [Marinilabiliaceae bacterium]